MSAHVWAIARFFLLSCATQCATALHKLRANCSVNRAGYSGELRV